jgi:hypothetical protein
MSLEIPRPVDPSLHPLVTGNYRIATPAIEAFYELVVRCLRYRIMGALIYGPSRIGKTRAIEYVRLLLARNYRKRRGTAVLIRAIRDAKVVPTTSSSGNHFGIGREAGLRNA